MTMELGFPLTFNFATLYLGKLEVYIFSRWRIVFMMSCKIFMNFVKILKLLWIFEVIVKKIHVNYKIYTQTSFFYCMCISQQAT
jgi:hypothetical protein